MLIRELTTSERELQAQLGALTVRAYRTPFPDIDDDEYATELADVARRVAVAVVLVALEGDDLLGGVTYVPGPASPLAEFDAPGAASIRMLAVEPLGRGRGVGEALVVACLDRARAAGRSEVVLHSSDRMEAAHRLYGRMGFRRAEELDWSPQPDLPLLGFRLALSS